MIASFHHARARGFAPNSSNALFVKRSARSTTLLPRSQWHSKAGGRFIHMPADVVVDEPIVIFYDASEQFPYTLVSLGEGAQAVIIEEIGNEKAGDEGAILCGISEVLLADRARLSYIALQQTGGPARSSFS